MPTEFQINVDAIVASSRLIGDFANNAAIAGAMKSIVKLAMIEVFEEAMDYANSYDGFPVEWQQHTMNVVRGFNDFVVTVGAFGVYIGIDFDALGTQSELRRAFHQGAMLEGGGHLWGPYEGQALASKDSEAAHTFWEAIRYNQKTAFNPATGKRMPTSKVPYQWDEVVNKYVEIWGEKCPEWLFIQYGQEEWEPIVPQFDLEGEVGYRLGSLAETMLAEFLDDTVRIANLYRSAGAEVGYTGSGTPRLESPLLTVGSKTYRKGQFVPKNF